MDVVLVEPSIAPNTGNIIRLCANTGTRLHLVEPLGFTLDEKGLRRGGLDYHDLTETMVHTDLEAARSTLTGRWLLFSARAEPGRRPGPDGRTEDPDRPITGRAHVDVVYRADDVLVFGNEQWGLPDELLDSVHVEQRVAIPMMPANRSLNLANAVAIAVYEAWRQVGFDPDGPGAQVPSTGG